MTDLSDLLVPDAVVSSLAATNKKTLFQQIGAVAARAYGLDAKLVTDRLAEREKLGSTGFGAAVAIPHGKLEELRHVTGIFVQLEKPIDFAAVDELPVDLVFVLLSPIDAGAEHLKALAAVSRTIRHAPTLEKLRGARSRDALAAVLMGVDERDAA